MSDVTDIRTVPLSDTGAGEGVPPVITAVGDWHEWFAWHPVRLYTTGRFAWLRAIYRRCITKNRMISCDYTDTPGEYPPPPSLDAIP